MNCIQKRALTLQIPAVKAIENAKKKIICGDFNVNSLNGGISQQIKLACLLNV
jgi:hypothetical protein